MNPAPLRITIERPVSSNNAYATGRNGRRYKTPEANAYGEAVELLTMAAAREAGFIASARVFALTLFVSFPDARRRDADGVVKLTQDAICRALGIDDSRVHEVTVTRCANDPARGAYLEAIIEPAAQIALTAAEVAADYLAAMEPTP